MASSLHTRIAVIFRFDSTGSRFAISEELFSVADYFFLLLVRQWNLILRLFTSIYVLFFVVVPIAFDGCQCTVVHAFIRFIHDDNDFRFFLFFLTNIRFDLMFNASSLLICCDWASVRWKGYIFHHTFASTTHSQIQTHKYKCVQKSIATLI